MGFWVFFSDDRVEYYDSDACALYLSPDRTIEIVDNSKIITVRAVRFLPQILSALIVAKSILVFPPLHMRFISLIVVDA